MKRWLLGIGVGLVAIAAMAAVMPPSEFQLFMLLNGEPTKLGVLTSTGTSVTQATTGVPFTIASTDCASRVFMFQCDTAQANVGPGATCDTTVTGANHKKQLANAWDPFYMVLNTATSICLDAPASTTINCAVFCMK
jgi:hypothetical protein